MSQQFMPTAEPTIEDVSAKFETWRKTRKNRKPIPAKLWKAAVDLTANYPVYKIAKKLQLNYTQLKERAHAAKTDLPIEKAPAFIELDFGPPAMASECVIQMQDPNGGEMTLQLKGDKCPDPIDICKAFWRRDS